MLELWSDVCLIGAYAPNRRAIFADLCSANVYAELDMRNISELHYLCWVSVLHSCGALFPRIDQFLIEASKFNGSDPQGILM